MSRFNRIPQNKKDAILKRIEEDGVNANRATNEVEVSPKTVYGWLSKETTKLGVSWHELNRISAHLYFRSH